MKKDNSDKITSHFNHVWWNSVRARLDEALDQDDLDKIEELLQKVRMP